MFHLVQHPNLRTIRWNTTTQWYPLVKLDATGQMLRPEVFGLCLEIEAYPMTNNIFKRHYIPETFISIDNNIQRSVRLHNIDRLGYDTAFWNLHFYTPKVISEEILGSSMLYWCLYYPYSLPQRMTFSDLQPKLKKKYKLTLNLVTLSATCLFMHVNWSAVTDQIDFL